MVSPLSRHSFPTENTEAGLAILQKNTKELIDGLEEHSTRLGDAQQITLTLAKSHCLLDPEAAIYPTWDAWVTAMQVSSAVFAAATPWIDTLQTYWLGGADLGAKLVTAVDGTDPQAVADPETVGRLLYPPMAMFHRFVRKDRAGFNQALTNALQWHKEYWSEESRTFQASGLVALAPFAIACFAYDAGIPIEVEPEYLPIALLERNWCGEFPT